jgi:hypothetical protein
MQRLDVCVSTQNPFCVFEKPGERIDRGQGGFLGQLASASIVVSNNLGTIGASLKRAQAMLSARFGRRAMGGASSSSSTTRRSEFDRNSMYLNTNSSTSAASEAIANSDPNRLQNDQIRK